MFDRPCIAMPAGLAQGPAREKQTGPFDQPLLNRGGQAEVGSGRIPYAGKATLESVFQQRAGVLAQKRHGPIVQAGEIDMGGIGVKVGVDQTGHEKTAAQTDFLGTGGLERPLGDLLDFPVFDQDVRPVEQLGTVAVEDDPIA